MKKVLIAILILALSLMPIQAVHAESNFTLVRGDLAEKSDALAVLQECLQSLQITSSYSAEKEVYLLSGSNSAQATATQGSVNYIDTGKGDISGEYDPASGGFSGTFSYQQNSDATDSSTGIHMNTTLFDMKGQFTGTANQGDSSVEMTFRGTNTLLQGYTKDYEWHVTFAVEGALPSTAEETAEPTETPTPVDTDDEYFDTPEPYVPETPRPEVVTTNIQDSGARFSDLSGTVEVNIPIGLDKDGKEVWDMEAWNYAELNMVLPVGTRIRTQHKSSAIISFADMTTFVENSKTHVILSSPTAKDSQIGLLWGNLKANVKKMMKDGSMQVEMSQAVAGIKGTIFTMQDDGITSTLKVIEGTVAFTSKATGQTVKVNAGETISATSAGLGEKQPFDTGAEQAAWALLDAQVQQQGLPVWALVLIITAAVLLAAGIVISIVVSMRKRKQKPAQMPTGSPSNAGASIEAKLGQLESLKEQGLITDTEYAQKRKEIIDSLL